MQWQDDARRVADRDLSTVDYVYLWADGIHFNVRLNEGKLCLLVMVGVRVDGAKELVALVRAGATFNKGKLVERTTTCRPTDVAA